MHVVLAGASGLIGTALRGNLVADGHQVTTLVRRTPAGPDEQSWDPAAGQLDAGVLAGADAVVCLSGAAVDGRRWTQRYKNELVLSRTDPVGLLARTLASHPDGPRVLLSASAVGYYGDTGARTVDESAAAGTGFLAELCQRWEAAAEPAAVAGVRVVRLRTGLVLSSAGGLLARLRPIVRWGVGGRIGSGEQYLPWISLADEIGAIRLLLEQPVAGPVNLTGPNPSRNADFIAELARQLHRPAVLPAPAFALRAVLGELGNDALTGQRAVPAALTAAGYRFAHPTLAAAISWAFSG
jgi:hypothetical protein